MANHVLSFDSPAYILDSLYHVRAWNSLATHMLRWPGRDRPDRARPVNIMRLLFTPTVGTTDPQTRNSQVTNWLSHFWQTSAHLCGSEPYRNHLAELSTLPGFSERWRALAFGEEGDVLPYVGAPYEWQSTEHGRFRVVPSVIMLPPPYHVRLLLPVDEQAMASLEAARKVGNSVGVADMQHWAVT